MIARLTASSAARYWPRIAPLLQRALDRGPATHATDDLLREIEAGELTLFLAGPPDDPQGVALVEIAEEPRLRTCSVAWLAGRGFRDWIGEMQAAIEHFGRAEGCRLLEARGRPGWGRVTDLRPAALVLNKEL